MAGDGRVRVKENVCKKKAWLDDQDKMNVITTRPSTGRSGCEFKDKGWREKF